MIKGSSMVLREISNGALRRGSTELVSNMQRRNSICGPCIGLDLKQSNTSTLKMVSDESLGTFLENSSTFQDLQPQQEFNKSLPYPSTARKGSIAGILKSINIEKLKNSNPLTSNMMNGKSIDFNRRFSVDPLTIKKFKSINLDEKFMELEAESTFSSVWSELVNKYGLENLEFPKEIIFLAGAPGSGKGTNCESLKQALGIEQDPIVMSSLLNSPECIEIKKAGGLVNDKVVLELLLNKLAKPDFLAENMGPKKGVIIDGFPRSPKQVKFVELLFDKLYQIRSSINPNATLPRFRISVLHVSEEESVKRQLSRGESAIKENAIRKENDLPLLEIRDTDTNEEACKKRYSIYKDQFNNLKSLENKFDFDLIDAGGTKDQVKNIIHSTYQNQPQL